MWIVVSSILLTGQIYRLLQIRLEVHIVLDFGILLPQHGNLSITKDDRVFVDIFSAKCSGGCIDQTFQPTLKIRRLGPLVHREVYGKSFRITDQSVEVYVFWMSDWALLPSTCWYICFRPLSMQHVDIAISIENPKYSPTKLGNIEKDIDAILNVSLKEGFCEWYNHQH